MTEKEKFQYELHTAAVIKKNQLEKDVQAEYISKSAAEHYLAEYIRRLLYPGREKTDEKVLTFIGNITGYHYPNSQKQDSIYELFASGYCYYFALMLKDAFQRGEVCWCAPHGHICWVDDNGHPYDIHGSCDSECDYFIPILYIQDGLADFKHVPGKVFDASEEYIQDALQKFEKDLRISEGVPFSWEEDAVMNERRVLDTVHTMKQYLRDEMTILINENYMIKTEILLLIGQKSAQIAVTLCDKNEHCLITAVSDYSDEDKLKKNVQLLLQYMDGQPEEIWAAINASNIFYYFQGITIIYPFECTAPELKKRRLFILITSDKAEYTGDDEDVLSLELRGDSDVLSKEIIPKKEVSEKIIAEKLLKLRHIGTKKLEAEM